MSLQIAKFQQTTQLGSLQAVYRRINSPTEITNRAELFTRVPPIRNLGSIFMFLGNSVKEELLMTQRLSLVVAFMAIVATAVRYFRRQRR